MIEYLRIKKKNNYLFEIILRSLTKQQVVPSQLDKGHMPGTGVPIMPEQNDAYIHSVFSPVELTYSEHADCFKFM
jgi:hypothetical protein